VVVLALLATVATLIAGSQQTLLARARTNALLAVRLAEVDGLTGCLIYRALHARLVEEAANATATHPLSGLILDVDHFKAINDGHGHPAGE